MKKILLSLAIIASAFIANSQVICAGISPASIAGNYAFEWADPGGGDWATPDFNIAGTFIQASLIMVNDGTAGTNPQGNPMSAESCFASPANAYDGKIAVLYRNTCEFGAKAKFAQDAGAIGVIIINRDPDAVGMGGGVEGLNVTIPTVMIGSVDGAAIVAEMAAGDVVMLLGNKVGTYVNDIGSASEDILIAPFAGAHAGSFDGFELAMMMYNFGSATQANITATAEITDPSSAIVYSSMVNVPSMDTGDTTFIAAGEALTFPPFSLPSYALGTYTLTYTLEMGVADESDFDNVFTSSFTVNNDVISLASLDGSNLPTASTYPSNSTTEYQSCMFYTDPNASSLSVEGVYFIPFSDSIVEYPLAGEEFNINFYTVDGAWTDLNDPSLTAFADIMTDLTLVDFVQYYPVSDAENGTAVYAPLNAPIQLVNDTRYMVCIQSFNPQMAFGYDGGMDYDGNGWINAMPISPVYVDDTWYSGWVGPSAPSIGLKTSVVGLNEITEVSGKAFPNPANDVVTISVEATGNATISVTDVAGKVVMNNDLSLVNGTADMNIDSLESGMYIFTVVFEGGETSTFNVVKK